MMSFRDHFTEALSGMSSQKRKLGPGECQTTQEQRCTLCNAVEYSYEYELKSKNIALAAFWKSNKLPGVMTPILESPRGRAYRTVSKRKAFRVNGVVRLALTDLNEGSTVAFRPLDIVRCQIEPDEHALIYHSIQHLLEKSFSSAAAAALNYVVVKGSYTEHSVIFSLSTYNPLVSKAFSRLTKLLLEACDTIVALFLFIDEGGSFSTLAAAEEDHHQFKRLVGKKEIEQFLDGKPFLYSTLSFTNSNLSMEECMLQKATELLAPHRSDKLIDIYCNYGLFSLGLCERVNSVIGVDTSANTIEWAQMNLMRQRMTNVRFVKSEIHETTLKRILKGSNYSEIVILNPKISILRNVIDFITSRNPRKVLYICYEMDILPGEIQRWQKNNFQPTKILPLDLTPGLPGLAAMVLLEKQ